MRSARYTPCRRRFRLVLAVVFNARPRPNRTRRHPATRPLEQRPDPAPAVRAGLAVPARLPGGAGPPGGAAGPGPGRAGGGGAGGRRHPLGAGPVGGAAAAGPWAGGRRPSSAPMADGADPGGAGAGDGRRCARCSTTAIRWRWDACCRPTWCPDCAREVFDKLQRLDFRFFDATPPGSIINRVTGDVQSLRSFIDGVLIQSVILMLSLAVYLVYMLGKHVAADAGLPGLHAAAVAGHGAVLPLGAAGLRREPPPGRQPGAGAVRGGAGDPGGARLRRRAARAGPVPGAQPAAARPAAAHLLAGQPVFARGQPGGAAEHRGAAVLRRLDRARRGPVAGRSDRVRRAAAAVLGAGDQPGHGGEHPAAEPDRRPPGVRGDGRPGGGAKPARAGAARRAWRGRSASRTCTSPMPRTSRC